MLRVVTNKGSGFRGSRFKGSAQPLARKAADQIEKEPLACGILKSE